MAGTGREPFNVTAPKTAPSSPIAATRSPWHSPVPYLFGGLAAMLGLIAFALLILACSYWKLSGYLENGNNEGAERDLEAGEGESNKNGEKQGVAFEEKILVIMAGQVKPTFLATPMSSRSSSFGDNDNSNNNNNNNKTCCCGEKSEKLENGSSVEMVKQQQGSTSDHFETHESSQSHQTN